MNTQKEPLKGDWVVCSRPGWKIQIWGNISKEAKAKNVFPSDCFDNYGLLRFTIRFQELTKWLDNLTNREVQFLQPEWEYQADGKWKLSFYEEWQNVERMDDQQAVSTESIAKYDYEIDGIIVQGLVPELYREYDFCSVDDEEEADDGVGDDFVDVAKEYDMKELTAVKSQAQGVQNLGIVPKAQHCTAAAAATPWSSNGFSCAYAVTKSL